MTHYTPHPHDDHAKWISFEAWRAIVYPDGLPENCWLSRMIATFGEPTDSQVLDEWHRAFVGADLVGDALGRIDCEYQAAADAEKNAPDDPDPDNSRRARR